MNTDTLLYAISDVDEQKICRAGIAMQEKELPFLANIAVQEKETAGSGRNRHTKKGLPFRAKRIGILAAAACLCLATLGTVAVFRQMRQTPKNESENFGSVFGNGTYTLLAPHRGDFSSGLSPAATSAFEGKEGLLKFYPVLPDDWFLAENLTDFSQILEAKELYALPGDKNGSHTETAYSVFSLDENGSPSWLYTAAPSSPQPMPHGLFGLNDEIIEAALSGIAYDDYIIADSHRLGTVFLWVRCQNEDVFLAYPYLAHPEWLGLETGRLYRLQELQDTLKEAYQKSKNEP